MRNPLFCIALAGLALCGTSGVIADVLVLTPSKDNTLYENNDGTTSNGKGAHLYVGLTGGAGGFELRRAVLEFDLSVIPPGSQIHSAELAVSINKKGESTVTNALRIHRLLGEWGEGTSDAGAPGGVGTASTPGDATWIHRFYTDQLWTSAGGDYEATATDSAFYNNVDTETLNFDDAAVTSEVQFWVDNPGLNHGWIIIGDEINDKTARRLYSRESIGTVPGLVPTLTVDFTPASVTDHLSLVEVTDGLSGPVVLTHAPDGSDRLFIVEQSGVIRIYDTANDILLATPYLDIESLVESPASGGGNEQGLLGLAFHPDFASNRQFYVYYTRDPGPGLDRSRIAMYQQSAGNVNIADTTEVVVLEFEQNASNHNGGDIHFGADGYLYIASGDGGGSNDQYDNAQNVDTLLGAMLRIDVDGVPTGGEELCGLVNNYAIPPGNAFPGGNDGCDEILHFGLRNPWRFSFDALTEDMYIGDVGQNLWEEVDFVPAGTPGGLNFGWSCREGAHDFASGNACLPGPLAEPAFEYSSASGGNCSITGGYVYRGPSSLLYGYYVYGDYCSDRIWLARRENGTWVSEEWEEAAGQLNGITSFGQGPSCELYVVEALPTTGAGTIYRIDDAEMVQRGGFESLRCQ